MAEDLSDWTVHELDQLALFAYANVEGVEVVEKDEDFIPEHGLNDPSEME